MTSKEKNKIAMNLTAIAFAKQTDEEIVARVFELASMLKISPSLLLTQKEMLHDNRRKQWKIYQNLM